MNRTCNFCLEEKHETFEIHDISIKDVMKTVFPTKDIDSFKDSIICITCLSNLKSAYNFIKNANDNNRKVSSANSNLCRTCIKPVNHGGIYLFDHIENEVPYYEIKEMLDYSSLDLDVEYHQRPVICNCCWTNLNKSYNFVKKCTEIEKEKRNFNNDPDVKIEFETITIKEEDTVDDIKIEIDDHSNTHVNSPSVICLNEENSEKHITKELYVKLTRLNLLEVMHGAHKSKNRKHKCAHCGFMSSTTYKHNKHLLTHMTLEECAKINSLFKCHKCTYLTKNKHALQKHLKKVHRSAYVCEKCDFETDHAESFTIHIKTKHDDHIGSYICKACPYISHNKLKFLRHVKFHDSQNIILRCSLCDFKTKERTQFEEHKIHHKSMWVKKIYKCEKCHYEAKKKVNMDRHVLRHLTKKELSDKMYACSQCHFKTKRKDSLPTHIKNIHGGSKNEKK